MRVHVEQGIASETSSGHLCMFVYKRVMWERGDLLQVAVARGKGVDAVLSEHLAHLSTGRVRDESLGLQHRPQKIHGPQVVLQGPGWAGPDDAIAHQLCI